MDFVLVQTGTSSEVAPPVLGGGAVATETRQQQRSPPRDATQTYERRPFGGTGDNHARIMQELRHRMQDLECRLAERERDQRSPERSPTRSRSRSRSRRTPSPQYESESTGGRVHPRRRSRDPIIYARHERRRASNRGDEEVRRENDESRRTVRGPIIIGATPFHRSDALEQAIRDGKLADFSHLIREPRRRNRDNDNEDRSRPTRRRQEPEGDDHGLTVVNVVTARNTAPRSKSAQKKDAKVLAVSTSSVRSLKGLPPISFGPEDQWFDEGRLGNGGRL
ncbi:serine/arginine-rich splicing factor 11-like [Arachis ipaensis]|uniref:serine/arginine-rich splicing factor 11-like n=1 Tax=Arachis ipaensis TaxID=130454 RepID=UPI0007AFB60C|nr:serine/arginine-rich splicing factor 11-like [Arachis ipaensis]